MFLADGAPAQGYTLLLVKRTKQKLPKRHSVASSMSEAVGVWIPIRM